MMSCLNSWYIRRQIHWERNHVNAWLTHFWHSWGNPFMNRLSWGKTEEYACEGKFCVGQVKLEDCLPYGSGTLVSPMNLLAPSQKGLDHLPDISLAVASQKTVEEEISFRTQPSTLLWLFLKIKAYSQIFFVSVRDSCKQCFSWGL